MKESLRSLIIRADARALGFARASGIHACPAFARTVAENQRTIAGQQLLRLVREQAPEPFQLGVFPCQFRHNLALADHALPVR
jgi:hypothetical protein